MNERGRWVSEGQRIWPDGTLTGEPLRSRMASFWLGGVAAAYQPWVSLVERYLQAVKQYATTGETKPLKTTVNVDQAMPFVPPSATKQRGAHELQQRCEDWTPAHVPPGVRFLTAQVDIQGGQNRRFVVQVIGWGAGREKWLIDRYALKTSERLGPDGRPAQIDPSAYVEDWRRLIEKCIDQLFARSGVPATGIDTVFLTGGSSFVPAVRAIFERKFPSSTITGGHELTSVATGLALRAAERKVG